MNLTLQRVDAKPAGIFSQLVNGNNRIAEALEHSYQDQASGLWLPKIPPGFYTCVRGVHRLHADKPAFETFEITGVAGHTGLLFHCGNREDDSEGCVLLGMARVVDILAGSHVAFDKFMGVQQGLNSFVLQVVGLG